MTVIEVEDYYGNTIGAVLVKGNIEILKLENFEIADKDGDYIFDTDNLLIRLQCTEKDD